MTAKRIQEHAAAGTPTGAELLPAAQLSTTVTTTATNISAVAASNKFVRGSGSWITDGFSVGRSVKASGWTGGTANNKTARTITELTATDMTFGGTDGDDIVDDAGGESVTVTAWEPVQMSAQEIADLGAGVSDAADVAYTPADPSDWSSSADPGDVNQALDQLALRVLTLEEAGGGAVDAAGVTYAPADASDWSSSADPGDVNEALDQLATRAQALEDAGAGSTVGLHMIAIDAGAMHPRYTGGCEGLNWLDLGAGKPEVAYLAFDSTTQEFATFNITMPKSWNASTITFEVDWMHPSTTTNFGVVFGLSAAAFGNGDDFNVSFGTAQTVSDTGGTTNAKYTTPTSSAITIANTPAKSDTVCLQLSRNPSDGSDTLAVDARVIAVRVYITTDAETDA